MYSVVDLDPNGTFATSEAVDINDQGQIALTGWTDSNKNSEGFLWDDGSSTIFSAGRYTKSKAINGHGDIVGHARGESSDSEGFFWNDGESTLLGHSPGGQEWTRAQDINDSGLVVGHSLGDPQNRRRAITWQAGMWHDLGLVDVGFDVDDPLNFALLYSSDAIGVNNAGQILGYTQRRDTGQTPQVSTFRTWILKDGQVSVLPTLSNEPDASILPLAINERGEVLGKHISTNYDSFAGVWRDGEIIKLDDELGGKRTGARDLNDHGISVGLKIVSNDPDRDPIFWNAVIWDKNGRAHELNDMLDDSGDGWVLLNANAINNSGWIVGMGLNPQGVYRGFLLKPIPEPTTSTLVLTALCLAMGGRRGF